MSGNDPFQYDDEGRASSGSHAAAPLAGDQRTDPPVISGELVPEPERSFDPHGQTQAAQPYADRAPAPYAPSRYAPGSAVPQASPYTYSTGPSAPHSASSASAGPYSAPYPYSSGPAAPQTAPYTYSSGPAAPQPSPYAPSSASAAPQPAPSPYAPVATNAPQQMPYPGPTAPPVVVVQQPKSVAVALVLTFFFGALGMLYSTVTGALVMIGAFLAYLVVAGVISAVTLGIGGFVLLPLAFLFWPAQMIWAAVAVSNYNSRLQPQAVAAYPRY